MNNLITTNQPLTMSSREIAELVQKRHDNVKRTIDTLLESGVIVRPQIEDEQDTDKMGRTRTTSVYLLEKRDTYVVVAQMSPEFTAHLVDRWQDLEQQAQPQFDIPKTYYAALLLAANQTKVIEEQEEKIADMQEDVNAHTRLTQSEGSLSITEAAKNLGIRPRALFTWLSTKGWIYKRAGAKNWLGYADKCNKGFLAHTCETILIGQMVQKRSLKPSV